mgnify:CR=1 FL=1
MNSIQPNDIKKGDLGYLKNGWKFEMMDKVHGIETEIGSIYAHEIAFIQNQDGDDVPVDASRYQKQTTMIQNLGF